MTPARIALVAAVFVAGLAGALLFLKSEPSGSGGSRPAVTSDIWGVGDEWVVKVRQDAGAITPDGDTSIATIPFRFEVMKAPKTKAGSWTVHVTQDGAEGPFANGWDLIYRAKGDEMALHRIRLGNEPALEAELAAIVLGPQFPYETSYDAAPRDQTINAARLLKRSALPPSAVPGGDGTSGMTPPAEAPHTGPGGAPDISGDKG